MPSDDRREQALKRVKAKRVFRTAAGIAISASVVINVVWLVTGSDSYWPMWAMIALVIWLGISAFSAYGPREDPITDDEVEREAARRDTQ